MQSDNSGTALLRAFLVSLVLVSLPIKNFAYVAPAGFMAVLFWHREYRFALRVCLLVAGVVSVSLVAVLWDHLGGRAVNPAGVWLAPVTYAPLLMLLSERFRRRIDDPTHERLVSVCVWFLLVQSVIGVLQFAAVGNPDAVSGTFGLLDGFHQEITISQVYFTFTMFGMILFLLPVSGRRMPMLAIAAGTLTCVVAQSGHQTIFLIASLALCGVLRSTNPTAYLRTLAGAGAIGLLVLLVYPETLWLSREWYVKVTDERHSAKRMVVDGAAEVLAQPKNFLIGTGLGQYTSRAALITSNEYLSVELPAALSGRSRYFDDYLRPALRQFESNGEGSAMAKPYMSAVSLPVELGVPLTLVLAGVVLREALRCFWLMRHGSEETAWTGFSALVGMLFFWLCCLVENYAEFTQAVFLPFILYAASMSRARASAYAETETVGERQPAFGLTDPLGPSPA